jgi:hypothetical protein
MYFFYLSLHLIVVYKFRISVNVICVFKKCFQNLNN